MIYETKGRAREYFQLAANLYLTCQHGCVYCYGPEVLKVSREDFFGQPRARRYVVQDLAKDAAALQKNGEARNILLSFIGDPYQPIEAEWLLTRRAIEVLKAAHLKVAILTKAGGLATRDFDLLDGDDMFGVTLVFTKSDHERKWEPNAAPLEERIRALVKAKERGLKTFVSLEPVIYPDESLDLIRLLEKTRVLVGGKEVPIVDYYKVGKLNYNRPPVEVNWSEFAWNVIKLLNQVGAKYYIKDDLAKYIDRRGFHGGKGEECLN